MKNILRSVLILAWALCLCFVCTACGEEENNHGVSGIVDTDNAEYGMIILSQDSFDNGGFTCRICAESGYYNFRASPSDEVSWAVYLTDEKFLDAARYIPQAVNCALKGEGLLYIEQGQYIYVCCSVNEMTADSAVHGAQYSITPASGLTSLYTVRSEDSYYNYGFTSWECTESGEYAVSVKSGGSNVTWSIYVLDGEFEDADRYIPQAYSCQFEGSGLLSLSEGQYVYIKCSANDFSADQPASGSEVSIFCIGSEDQPSSSPSGSTPIC